MFEGSEKKLEVTLASSIPSLRTMPQSFWQTVVGLAGADVLSRTTSQHCDAYVLSESSLFVWDHKIVMLTCGLSTLIDSACHIIKHFAAANIDFFSYQRKNEYFAAKQPSSFEDDAKLLNQLIAGRAQRVGHLDSHHHFLFTSTKAFMPAVNDSTIEVMMYHIDGDIADYLKTDNQSSATIRDLLQLNDLFEGFTFDDYVFSPLGYSVNGVKGHEYFTIHITPQEVSSYVSIETNIKPNNDGKDFIALLLQLLQPKSWDVIGFNHCVSTTHFPSHHCVGACSYTIEQGYRINIHHYQQTKVDEMVPVNIL